MKNIELNEEEKEAKSLLIQGHINLAYIENAQAEIIHALRSVSDFFSKLKNEINSLQKIED